MSSRSLMVLLTVVTLTYPRTTDYNGNPINRSGGITLTPQTSSAIIASYTQATNLDGLLDYTFGSLGIVTTFIAASRCTAFASLLQSDGKVIALGGTNVNATGQSGLFALVRYNENGSPDTSFGTNSTGIVTTNITANAATIFGGVLQPDGKIVVVGGANTHGPGVGKFTVARYLTNGSLDTTFGAGVGFVKTTISAAQQDIAYAALLQPDGKIIAVGGTSVSTNPKLFALIRYNSNGTPDNSFGTSGNGIVTTSINATDTAYAALLQPDGKIIALGTTNITGGTVGLFALVRYTTNGLLDTTFGPNKTGIVTTPITTSRTAIIYAATFQPDGKIVIAGEVSVGTPIAVGKITVARYMSDGSLDTTFGAGAGFIQTTISTTGIRADSAYAISIQPDGKIVIAGGTSIATIPGNFFVIRYNYDGTLDTIFGSNGTGIAITPNDGLNVDQARSVIIRPNGKIIAVGGTNVARPDPAGTGLFALNQYTNPFTFASFTASYGTVGLL